LRQEQALPPGLPAGHSVFLNIQHQNVVIPNTIFSIAL